MAELVDGEEEVVVEEGAKEVRNGQYHQLARVAELGCGK